MLDYRVLFKFATKTIRCKKQVKNTQSAYYYSTLTINHFFIAT